MRAPFFQTLVLAVIRKATVVGAGRSASVSPRLRYDLLGNLDPTVPPTMSDIIGTQIHVQSESSRYSASTSALGGSA
jgi:hypothetical protein